MMLRLTILMLVLAATAKNIQERSSSPLLRYSTAASESQVQFAIENKYDDTGPGAKQPEYAYKTYNNLDDAIIAYINDPDTKLPENEKLKAFSNIQSRQQTEEQNGYYPGTVAGYTSYKSTLQPVSTGYNYPYKVYYQNPKTKSNYLDFQDNTNLFKQLDQERFNTKNTEAYKHQKLQLVKGNPLSVAHYARDPDLQQAHHHFNPYAKYTYSYGVQDRSTGDAKSAKETRDGGTVHGYYSLTDPFGKLRTVHYTADDAHGYRATVDRSNI